MRRSVSRRLITLAVVAGAILVAVTVVAVTAPTNPTSTFPPTSVPPTASSNTCPTATTRPFPPPFPTLSPEQRATPGALQTVQAHYDATYPRDGYQNVKTTDLAPQAAANDKAQVFVQHADCSYEKFLLRQEDIGSFAASLPKGDRLGAVINAPGQLQSTFFPPLTPPTRIVNAGSVTVPAVTLPNLPPATIPAPLQTSVAGWEETAQALAATATAHATPTK